MDLDNMDRDTKEIMAESLELPDNALRILKDITKSFEISSTKSELEISLKTKGDKNLFGIILETIDENMDINSLMRL